MSPYTADDARALDQLPDVTPWPYSHGDGYPPETGAHITLPCGHHLLLEREDAEAHITAVEDALEADVDEIRAWDAADEQRAREKEEDDR